MPASDISLLYALNPAERIDLVLDSHESPKSQGETLYNAIQSDLFLVRVEQIAWTHYRDKLNGKGDEKDPNLQGVIAKILNDTGLREVIVNTVVQIYEKNFSTSQSSKFCVAPMISRTSRDEPIDAIRQVGAVHCSVVHCSAVHCIAVHCIAVHCSAVHCSAVHCNAVHCSVV